MYTDRVEVAKLICNDKYYIKQLSDKWTEYKMEDAVIIQDLTLLSAAAMISQILQLSERIPCKVYVNDCDELYICPKVIVITSTYTINECIPENSINKMTKLYKYKNIGPLID